ncbi:hypothetical protein DTO271D3_205 [Paecilomyces variotii]|nr:hypothetical protein DTO271D3_205 [Paecilomyces variotii]
MTDDDANAPLLDRASRSPSPQRSMRSNRSGHQQQPSPFVPSTESTPLLLHHDDGASQYGSALEARPSPPASRDSSLCRTTDQSKAHRRLPTYLAIAVLSATIIAILVLGFVMPAAVKEYAEQAVVFKPTNLSIHSSTADGVRARVQGNFVLDASRVRKKSVRDLGRFGTWIAREVEADESEVQVYLPEYGNVLIGTAYVPSIKANVRNGHVNHIDFLTDLVAGDIAGIRPIANDWLAGRLGQLRFKATAAVTLSSGLLSLGTQVLSDVVTFSGRDLPQFPEFNITKLNVHEAKIPGNKQAMAVDVSATVLNSYPFKLTVPPLGFDILVPNCSPGDPYILVADAITDTVHIQPKQPTALDVSGLIHNLPVELTKVCPGQKSSPLDLLVANYIQGLETTIFVRGADSPSDETPTWIVDLMKSVIVPLPFAGHAFDNLIKNFSMTNVHFSLPDPLAEPGSPEAQPKISAFVNVLINLPEQMNFAVDIPRVRANADVFYHGNKLGFLDLKKWQPANATRLEGSDGPPSLLVVFDIKDAPLHVTDEDVFTEAIQALIFGGQPISLKVAADVDAEVKTALGQFLIRKIPAEGKINVKPPYGQSLSDINPRVESLKLLHTTETSVLVQAMVNFTNPTKYAAMIPLADVLLSYNGTGVAHLIMRNVSVVPGSNSGVPLELLWNPFDSNGTDGIAAGRDMLSQYVSGMNTTVTLQSHEGTIPALPQLGRAFSELRLDLQVPRLRLPGAPRDDDDDPDADDGPHFIKDATCIPFHLWTSTAVFTLLSPFAETTVFVTSVDAVAFYNHTEALAKILYQLPFAVPPGESETPRLPVDLNVNDAGLDVLKRALGGTLRMDAVAKIGVRMGEYQTVILYKGKGIGAKVRI